MESELTSGGQLDDLIPQKQLEDLQKKYNLKVDLVEACLNQIINSIDTLLNGQLKFTDTFLLIMENSNFELLEDIKCLQQFQDLIGTPKIVNEEQAMQKVMEATVYLLDEDDRMEEARRERNLEMNVEAILDIYEKVNNQSNPEIQKESNLELDKLDENSISDKENIANWNEIMEETRKPIFSKQKFKSPADKAHKIYENLKNNKPKANILIMDPNSLQAHEEDMITKILDGLHSNNYIQEFNNRCFKILYVSKLIRLIQMEKNIEIGKIKYRKWLQEIYEMKGKTIEEKTAIQEKSSQILDLKKNKDIFKNNQRKITPK